MRRFMAWGMYPDESYYWAVWEGAKLVKTHLSYEDAKALLHRANT